MARAKVHSDAELARRIGIVPQDMNAMRRGRRAISPETVAALCDVLQLPGDETREWVAIAIIENPKNASRAGMLKRALFACWALGVVAALSTITMDDAQGTDAGATSGTEALTTFQRTVYTLSRIWKALRPASVGRLCMARLHQMRTMMAQAANAHRAQATIAAAG